MAARILSPIRVCAGRPRAVSSPETSTEKMDRARLAIEHFISFAETFAWTRPLTNPWLRARGGIPAPDLGKIHEPEAACVAPPAPAVRTICARGRKTIVP